MTDRGGKNLLPATGGSEDSGSNRQQRMSKSNAHRQYTQSYPYEGWKAIPSEIKSSCVQSTNNMRYCRIKREQQCKELKEKLTELG